VAKNREYELELRAGEGALGFTNDETAPPAVGAAASASRRLASGLRVQGSERLTLMSW
jgi:hypothetical protein